MYFLSKPKLGLKQYDSCQSSASVQGGDRSTASQEPLQNPNSQAGKELGVRGAPRTHEHAGIMALWGALQPPTLPVAIKQLLPLGRKTQDNSHHYQEDDI